MRRRSRPRRGSTSTGYQRLVSFEVDGGGFDWFGNPPANRTLTAYGLMEFEDMAKVHDVDPQLIERTRTWLLRQRRGDGSWANEAGMLDDGLASSVQRGGQPDLASTAYIAWAVFGGGQAAGEAPATRSYLLGVTPQTIDDPYVLALTINALLAMETPPSDLAGHLDRLESLKQVSEDGKLVWWEQSQGNSTTFYGSGQAGSIETTAMASLALLRTNRSPNTARAALQWLIEQKDARGTWHSTQATILALKALLAGTEKPATAEESRRIEIRLGGETHREVVIPPDQSDVLQMISLSDLLLPGNDYQLELIDRTNTAVGFQGAFK